MSSFKLSNDSQVAPANVYIFLSLVSGTYQVFDAFTSRWGPLLRTEVGLEGMTPTSAEGLSTAFDTGETNDLTLPRICRCKRRRLMRIDEKSD
jgi:hypothetical protein